MKDHEWPINIVTVSPDEAIDRLAKEVAAQGPQPVELTQIYELGLPDTRLSIGAHDNDGNQYIAKFSKRSDHDYTCPCCSGQIKRGVGHVVYSVFPIAGEDIRFDHHHVHSSKGCFGGILGGWSDIEVLARADSTTEAIRERRRRSFEAKRDITRLALGLSQ